MPVLAVVGAVLALLTGLVNHSLRRLVLFGAAGLLIVYLALPFGEAVGFLSRHTLTPTLLGLTPVFPAFALIAVLALLTVLLLGTHPRLLGAVAAAGGIVTLTVALAWSGGQVRLATLQPIGGFMEVVVALALFALFVPLALSRTRLRIPLLLVGLVLGASAGLWLASDAGRSSFPRTEGYYRLLRPAAEGATREIIDSYNAGLEALNAQRRSIGLNVLEPLDDLQGFEGQRLPREAAEPTDPDAPAFRVLRPVVNGYGTPLAFLFAGLMIGGGLMLQWRPFLTNDTDLRSGILLALVVTLLAPAFAATDFSFVRLVEGWPFLRDFLDRSWPPDLGSLQEVASQMLITIEIALVGTFLAALFAVPLSFFASRNLTSRNPFMRTVFALTRGFFNIDRGVDTLILALVFVAAVGLGPFAGVLAMAIHSIADLGKVYSESIENVAGGPIEALEAVGASGSNVVRWAILPQVAPLFVGWTLYRFEINFRVSIVLGLVGAGGIGFFIQEKMGNGSYDQMVVAIIAIVIVVNIIDFASSYLRSRLV